MTPSIKRTIGMATALLAFVVPLFLNAQEQEEERALRARDGVVVSMGRDSMRTCTGKERVTGHQAASSDSASLHSLSSEEERSEYLKKMDQKLAREQNRIRTLLETIQKRHETLLQWYPRIRDYQEVSLRDSTGIYQNNVLMNYSQILAVNYGSGGGVDCVVLDTRVRPIEIAEYWTTRVIRLYPGRLDVLELETIQKGREMTRLLDSSSADVQIMALRSMADYLRSALYTMDMQIAAHYTQEEFRTKWQMGLLGN